MGTVLSLKDDLREIRDIGCGGKSEGVGGLLRDWDSQGLFGQPGTAGTSQKSARTIHPLHPNPEEKSLMFRVGMGDHQ